MLKKDLQKWLEAHPAISVRQIGIEAGYPDGGYFQRWIKTPAKFREYVSPRMQRKLKPILEKYGFKI